MESKWKVITSQEDLDKALNEPCCLLGVGAAWCDQSQVFLRELERCSSSSDISIAWLDHDILPGGLGKLGVRCVPMLLEIENGEVKERHAGRPSLSQLHKMVAKARVRQLEDYQSSSYLLP